MAMQTTAVARQLLSSNHVAILTLLIAVENQCFLRDLCREVMNMSTEFIRALVECRMYDVAIAL
jgi:hypothetical protein